MSKFPIRRVKNGARLRAGLFEGAAAPSAPHIPGSTAFDDAADTLRLRAALQRAVAKSDAPAYLIDAIRQEIRK